VGGAPRVRGDVVGAGRKAERTGAIAQAEGARVLVERRRGYGRAYRTGFESAQGEVIATADGDATYPVDQVPALVRQLLDEGLDFLSGDRMASVDRRSMTTEHRIGNWVLNRFVALAFHRFVRTLPGGELRDSQSGFWIFRRSVLQQVRLAQNGMALSEELKIEVIRHGLRFVEVPIPYGERFGPPKLQSWRDGLRNLLYLAEKRLEIAREDRHPPSAAGPQDGPAA